ncbi:MAG TPA: methyltransferase [Flavipsychrobacter sp.]
MSNSYFRFKQFTIHQDKCAMKVSTDACIAGAWTTLPQGTKRVLDIGAGTGLLTLMLAQKNPDIIIDGIELDAAAATQAMENVNSSPWGERINLIQADATVYPYIYTYDFVIANPPFFNNSLLGDTAQRNMARHTFSLSYQNLFGIIDSCLNASGMAAILLPHTEHGHWEQLLLDNDWSIVKKLLIHPVEGKPANRVVSICSRISNITPVEEHLDIRNADGGYTESFNRMMSPYYLDK